MRVQGYSDLVLLEQFNKGDSIAFKEVHNRFYSELFVFSMHIVKTKPIAEEIIQDSFLNLFKKHLDFTGIPNIKAFLYVATRNGCLNYLRSENRRRKTAIAFSDFLEANSHIELSKIEGDMLHEIYTAVDQLPKQCKTVMELLYVEGLEPKAISDALDISISTVYNHRQHAFKLLRAKFEKVIYVTILFLYLLIPSFSSIFEFFKC